MGLWGGLRWRYRTYVEPHVHLHRNPVRVVRRLLHNRRAGSHERPLAMLFADPTNSGDYAAYQGVRFLAGRPGVELFTAPVALRSTLRALEARARSNHPWHAVIVCGGGHLQGCFDGLWEGLLERQLPLVLFGVGAAEAPPKRKLTAPRLLEGLARQAKMLHVRDHYTRELLERHGAREVSVAPCPSTSWLHSVAQRMPRGTTHLLHAMHPVDLGFAGIDEAELRAHVRGMAEELGLEYDETQHMEGLSDRLLARYARAAVVVSSRLHGCIFSYAFEKPFFALVCDRKLQAFCDAHASDMPACAAADWETRVTTEALRTAMHATVSPGLVDGMAANVSAMQRLLQG